MCERVGVCCAAIRDLNQNFQLLETDTVLSCFAWTQPQVRIASEHSNRLLVKLLCNTNHIGLCKDYITRRMFTCTDGGIGAGCWHCMWHVTCMVVEFYKMHDAHRGKLWALLLCMPNCLTIPIEIAIWSLLRRRRVLSAHDENFRITRVICPLMQGTELPIFQSFNNNRLSKLIWQLNRYLSQMSS